MTTVSADRDLLSIGMVATRVQQPVHAVEQIAQALGIEPSWKLNGTPFFDSEKVQRIANAASVKEQV